jgi:hypothetical protein
MTKLFSYELRVLPTLFEIFSQIKRSELVLMQRHFEASYNALMRNYLVLRTAATASTSNRSATPAPSIST